MKLIPLALTALLLLCATTSVTAQSATTPYDGMIDTDFSISCSGDYCMVTIVTWMYVGTYPEGYWTGVSTEKKVIKRPPSQSLN